MGNEAVDSVVPSETHWGKPLALASSYSYKNAVRRVARARHFPINTCQASRHAVMLAAQIRNGYDFGSEHKQDRESAAVSILETVESLWKLRTAAAKEAERSEQ